MKQRPCKLDNKYWPRTPEADDRYVRDLEQWCDIVEAELERVRKQYEELFIKYQDVSGTWV